MAHAAVWPTTQVLLVKTIAPAAVAEGAPVREGNAFASLDGVELTAPCQCAATGTEIAQFQAGCEFTESSLKAPANVTRALWVSSVRSRRSVQILQPVSMSRGLLFKARRV